MTKPKSKKGENWRRGYQQGRKEAIEECEKMFGQFRNNLVTGHQNEDFDYCLQQLLHELKT